MRYRITIVKYEGGNYDHPHTIDIPVFASSIIKEYYRYSKEEIECIMNELRYGSRIHESIIENFNPDNLRFFNDKFTGVVLGIEYCTSNDGRKSIPLFAAIVTTAYIDTHETFFNYRGFSAFKMNSEWCITLPTGPVLDKVPREESGSIDDVMGYIDKNYTCLFEKKERAE